MRIGFLTIWFERGATYITKTLIKAIEGHELFVFARTGAVFGVSQMEFGEGWEIDNLKRYHAYKVHPPDFVDWVNENKLDMVVFNEEYDFDLVEQTKEKTNAKIITYLDFYMEAWKERMDLYDEVWCSTHRSYDMVKDFCNAKYIGWGVDTDLFKPTPEIMSNVKRDYVKSKNMFFPKSTKFTFFHNAGWLGNNYRKNTPMVIKGFDEASKQNLDITMFIHSQAEYTKLPPEIIEIIQNNDRLVYFIGNIPHPGMYFKGNILIFISKLEGLGLPLLEGMASGMSVIATDEPPMNEFVNDGITGDLIPVVNRVPRYDNVIFPEAVLDYNAFVDKLLNFQNRIEKGENARNFIEKNFSMENLKSKMKELL